MEQIRLVIVDDQKLFRQNLKTVIELRIPEAKVVGIAGNGQEALNIIKITQPNLLRLTNRELEVLRHIALGEDNQEIANSLHISEGTVKNYVSNIYEKLELRDRGQAIRFAILQGLV
jgi:DNA-binding NarL/FixJ family response regulator